MSERLNLLSFKGNMRILHLSWIAFFISFAVWFNHAPLMSTLRQNFGLTDQEVGILLILNVALTIPARILVGMLVDRFGPRRMFTLILVSAGVVCFSFALAQDFTQLAVTRFLLGFVGAGFVVGIRMIGEWFPARQAGIAQGLDQAAPGIADDLPGSSEVARHRRQQLLRRGLLRMTHVAGKVVEADQELTLRRHAQFCPEGHARSPRLYVRRRPKVRQ